MVRQKQISDLIKKTSEKESGLNVELHKAPIHWNLEKGLLSLFGIDADLYAVDDDMK